jgi:3-methyladenine DNA glycosylase AlkD
MTKAEVLKFLDAEQDPRGIANWKKHAKGSGGLKSYGIGLTRLRKYAKQLGRDPELAKQLWKTKIYEAKIISLLVDDPKLLTIEQAEAQIEQLHGGHLTHVFSSCDATLAKAPFVVELVDKWVVSKDKIRRSCGYGLLYEISKWKKKSAPDEAAFLAHVERIDKTYRKQPLWVLMAMGGALVGIGKRSKKLNAASLKVARKIGPIDFDPDGKCDPLDIAKHLTSSYAKQKLGL